MPQAIQTKYLGATNTRGSRIKATCERGSITIDYPHGLSGDAAHIAAADALVAKFVKEDEKRYGTNKNPWAMPRVCGGLPDGTCAHVYDDNHNTVLGFACFGNRQQFGEAVKRAKQADGTVAPPWCGILSAILKRAKV